MKWEVAHYSSSISNFERGLKRKFGLKEWSIFTLRKPAVFFGMYHAGDYLRLIYHRGPKSVFWCGSDILSLDTRLFWRWIIARLYAKHICENDVERDALRKMGILADIHPCLFDRHDGIPISYKPTKRPRVYMCVHQGREEEYGLPLVLDVANDVPWTTFHVYGVEGLDRQNVKFHGKVAHKKFIKEISKYQAALRLNYFDGFSEVLARSVLMGQWPISRIYYPYMLPATGRTSLLACLEFLRQIRVPNRKGRKYWSEKLSWVGDK